MRKGQNGPRLVMTDEKRRIAMRLRRIHERTSHKAIARRLDVSIGTLRHAMYAELGRK